MRPLVARTNEWISPQVVALRFPDQPQLAEGVAMGRRVLRALGFETGFSHMEWFLTPGGEAVFGEIGARAPGARLVHMMNYSVDADLFVGWAEAVCHGRLSQDVARKYNAAMVFKRAEGPGNPEHSGPVRFPRPARGERLRPSPRRRAVRDGPSARASAPEARSSVAARRRAVPPPRAPRTPGPP